MSVRVSRSARACVCVTARACVGACVCMHTHAGMWARLHKCTEACEGAPAYVRSSVSTSTAQQHTDTRAHSPKHTCAYTHAITHNHTCAHAYMHAHTRMQARTVTHTHTLAVIRTATHTHTQARMCTCLCAFAHARC